MIWESTALMTAIEAGFLQKPFSLAALARTLQHAVEG